MSQNEIKYVPRSFVYWDEYFGRFAPQTLIKQREQGTNTYAKRQNLYHMKEANTGLIKKIETNLQKFLPASTDNLPPHILAQYKFIIEKIGKIQPNSQV